MNKRFDEMIAPMREPVLKAGETYLNENGGDWRCIYVEGNVAYCVVNNGPAYCFDAVTGKAISFQAGKGYDLILPAPPVVISDAVLTTHIKARGFLADDLSRFEDARAHLAVVITAYLAEQGK